MDKLISFLSLEENKGNDHYDVNKYSMFKVSIVSMVIQIVLTDCGAQQRNRSIECSITTCMEQRYSYSKM